jgi:hypothetical protein
LLHKEFERAKQGGQSVGDFKYQLNELATLIGDITERQHVNWFWHGLQCEIQGILHPEYSRLVQVRAVAESAEQALAAMKKVNTHNTSPGGPAPS